MAIRSIISKPDSTELEINSYFNQIIAKANARRIDLLTQLLERREESRARDSQRQQMISQIAATKCQVEAGLKENPLKAMQEKVIDEMEKELETLKITPPKKILKFSVDSDKIGGILEALGEITEEFEPIDYSAFQPVVSVAKKGKAPGELRGPEGVAIDEMTRNIFVAEFYNSRVSVFSPTGEYIKSFGIELFRNPWGIAIQNNNLYVSDIFKQALLHFKLPRIKFLQQIGKEGSAKGEFCYPRQLCISQIGDVYVCDESNSRIQVLTSELKFKTIFTHKSMTWPVDIKLTEEQMYVLSSSDNPCLHVFTLAGVKIRSVLSRGEGLQLMCPLFFCIDRSGDIVIINHGDNTIKVFTPKGGYLDQIGVQGHEKGMFYKPRGIALTRDGKVICVSDNKKFGLQIFS